jgi:spermidine synthase
MKVNDARNHLNLTKDGHYDLIVAEPSNPWLTGVSNLFTAEYFEMGKRKLASDGVWSQWIQIYGMDTEDLRSLLGTFSDTYKHVHLYSTISDADLVLIGSDAPLDMNLTRFQEHIDANPKVKADLKLIGVDNATDILARFRLDRANLQELSAGVERNTDDNMRVEYSAPLHLYTWTGDENVLMLEKSVGKVPRIPFESTEGADGLIALAKSYEKLELWVQALMCLKQADKREPRRPDVEALYVQFQHELAKVLKEQAEED